jgi:hypothetical protein
VRGALGNERPYRDTKNVNNLYFLRPGAARFEKAEGYGGGVFDFAKAPDGQLWTSDMVSKHFYALPHIAKADGNRHRWPIVIATPGRL